MRTLANPKLLQNKYERFWFFIKHPQFAIQDFMWKHWYKTTIIILYKGDPYYAIDNWLIDNVGIKYLSWQMRIEYSGHKRDHNLIIKLAFWKSFNKKLVERILKVMSE